MLPLLAKEILQWILTDPVTHEDFDTRDIIKKVGTQLNER